MADVEKDKSKSKPLALQPFMDTHEVPLAELCERLGTHPTNGLPEDRARENLLQDGYNTLSPLPRARKWTNRIFSGYVVLLWIRTALYFAEYGFSISSQPHITSLLFAVSSCLVVSAYVLVPSIFEEVAFKRFLRSIDSSPKTSICVRGGQKKEIRSEELTLGDLLVLQSGDTVPADVRITEANNFWVDNSLITGESGPLEKSSHVTSSNPLETKNLVFLSAYVIEGTATGIVVCIGRNTVKGRLLHLASKAKSGEGAFSRDMSRLFGILTKIGIFVTVMTFICMFVLGFHYLDAFILTTTAFLAFLPQGLLMSIYMSVSLVMGKLSRQNFFFMNWGTLGSLGSCSVICTDKTGILTQNQIRLAQIWLDGQVFPIDEAESDYNSKFKMSPGWQTLQKTIVVNKPQKRDLPRRDTPTENFRTIVDALSSLLTSNGGNQPKKIILEKELPSCDRIHVSVHEEETSLSLLMNGDPEVILGKCSSVILDGNDIPIDSKFRSVISKDIRDSMEMGLDVIGFCDFTLETKDISMDSLDLDSFQSMRFIGFVSFLDPPRANVPEVISRCRMMGIRVLMTTGDSLMSSQGFARSVGLITKDKVLYGVESLHECLDVARVVRGDQMIGLSDKELEILIKGTPEVIFARVTPEQKATIVRACQGSRGETIAAIGYGVDDALALRASNIGIAMGPSNRSALATTADIQLSDGNFATVVYGIEEAMLFFDNLSKVISYSLSSNVAELAFFLCLVILEMPAPLSGLLVLFIDFGIDMLPAVSLMNEPPEYSYTNQCPNQRRLLNKRTMAHSFIHIGIYEMVAGLFGYLVVFSENGFMPSRLLGIRWFWNSIADDIMDSYGQEWTSDARKNLQTTAQVAFFITIALLQATNLIMSKTTRKSIFTHGMKNLYLNLALVLVMSMGVLGSLASGMGTIIQRTHLSLTYWMLNLFFVAFLFVGEEIRKWVFRSADGNDGKR